MKPLKILLSAYACRPNMGSEPGVGWNTVQELIKYHQVWVFTRQDNRPEIEAYTAKNPHPNLNFVYCEPPSWLKLWWSSTQLPHYYLWQLEAYFTARKLHQELDFDLAHHITYVRYSTPSFLALLPIPFIWGPVGGGEYAPQAFWQDFSSRGKIYEILRSSAHKIGASDPFSRITAQKSKLVQATTEDTAQQLRNMGATNVEIFSESGLSPAEITALGQYELSANSPVRFISMARLLHWKGLHLSIQAFAQANLDQDVEYWILGEGPEEENLKALTRQLKIEQQVKFWGRLPRDRTLNKLQDCQVLIHPSLHDSGGWVCLEAMAAGRPVICLDTGGPSVQVTEQTGYKIAPLNPQQTIQSLADAIASLAQNSELRQKMGQAGRQRVKAHFSWEVKGQQLAQLYQEIVQNNQNNLFLNAYSQRT